MIATVLLAVFGFQLLWEAKEMPPETYQFVSNIATLITVTSCAIVVYCIFKFITYAPPERPMTLPLRPIQVPPSYIIYAARRSGRRPEEFMVRGR